MSDLQCAARIVVLDLAGDGELLQGERPAAVWAGPGSHDTAAALADVLDAVCRDLPGAPTSPGALVRALDDVADEHRGECVAVVLTPAALTALARLALPEDRGRGAVVVEIDADGHRWAPWPVSGARGR